MAVWRVEAHLRTPLLAGAGEEQQFLRRTLDWLPGSVVRGSLARAQLARTGCLRHAGRGPGRTCRDCAERAACPFPPVFLGDHRVRFGDLRPAEAEGRSVLPVPYSFLETKYGHRLWNALSEVLAGRARPTLGEPWKRARGWLWLYEDGRWACAPAVRRELRTRTALDRATETAADAQLFSLQRMVPEPRGVDRLIGRWWVSDAAERALEAILAPHAAGDGSYLLSVGADTARGSGEVRLARQPEDSFPLFPALAERWAAFQRAFGSRDGVYYFTLDLLSPTLVRGRYGTMAVPRAAKDFRDLGLQAPEGLELVPAASYGEREWRGGFSLAWGLPKPREAVLAPGSVLVYRAPRAQEEAVLEFLAALEERGLGERRGEGWGEVLACSPAHHARFGGVAVHE